jgi:hypothetical protein
VQGGTNMGLFEKIFKKKQAKVDYHENATIYAPSTTVSINISYPIDVVWEYFVEPQNWIKWWGAMMSVQWQKGGVIEWEDGGISTIDEILPKKGVKLSGYWVDHYITFVQLDQNNTEFSFTDVAKNCNFGPNHNYDLYMSLKKFKEIIENNK